MSTDIVPVPLSPNQESMPSMNPQTDVAAGSVSVPSERSNGKAAQPLVPVLHLVESPRKRGVTIDFQQGIRFCEALIDVLTIALAVAISYFAYEHLGLGKHATYPAHTLLGVSLGCSLVLVLLLDRAGAYARCNSLLRVRETEQILRASAQTALIVLTASFFGTLAFPRSLLLLCLLTVPLVLFAQKTVVYLLIRVFHSRGYGIERVLIYGAGRTGRRVFTALKRSPRLGLDPVLFVDDHPGKVGGSVFEMGYERKLSAPVVAGPITRDLLIKHHIDILIITAPLDETRFRETTEIAFSSGARLSYVPSNSFMSDAPLNYLDVDGVLLASYGKPSRRFVRDVTKRLVDLLGAALFVVLGIPIFGIVSLMIKLDSSGPILFKQKRVGMGGNLFEMYKFRTMRIDASPYHFSPKNPNDSRITRFGRFLRRTSLDELPQLFNVIQGDMSLVGPRPEMPFIVEQYTPRDSERLQVKPGLTGLWQLSGDRAFLIHENLEYDLYYIQHRNFFMDLAILLHTSIFAMRGV